MPINPRLQRLPDLLEQARNKVSRLDQKIWRLQKRRRKLVKHADKQSESAGELEDVQMDIEVLLHEIEMQKEWYAERAHLPSYNVEDDPLRKGFEALRRAAKVWDVVATDYSNTYRSLASSTMDRTMVHLSLRALQSLDGRREVFHFQNANGPDLYVYPHFVALQERVGKIRIIDIKDVSVWHESSRFIEEEGVPGDSRVVGQTWRYTNNDGSRDRRFRDNYRIPIARYGRLRFSTSTGLDEEYLISDPAAARTFSKGFQTHKKEAGAFPIERYEEVANPGEDIRRRSREIDRRIEQLPEAPSHTTRNVAALLVALLVLAGAGAYWWKTIIRLPAPPAASEVDDREPQLMPVDVSPSQSIGTGEHSLTVVAAYGKLSPIRLTVDEDLRRPYWIERDSSIRFKWDRRVIVEGDLGASRLILNGYLFRESAEGRERITVTDSMAANYSE